MASVQADALKRNPKEKLVFVLDDLDLSWYPAEIEYAAQLWKEGKSIWDMAQILRPLDKNENAEDEVGLLIMHMMRQGIVTEKNYGLYKEVN